MEMENFFSRLTLDIIGKAVFDYEFDSLTHDDPVIEVRLPSWHLLVDLLCHPHASVGIGRYSAHVDELQMAVRMKWLCEWAAGELAVVIAAAGCITWFCSRDEGILHSWNL